MIVIIPILAALLLPTLGKAKANGQAISYPNNLNYYLDGIPGNMDLYCEPRLKGKLSQLVNSSPSAAFAILDASESELSAGDYFLRALGCLFGGLLWNGIPSDRHARGGNLSFVDGHVEHRRWSWLEPHGLHYPGEE